MATLNISYSPLTLHFKRPSGTSRGILTEKHSWILKIRDEANLDVLGIGECSIIEGLSPDFHDIKQYEAKLDELCKNPSIDLSDYPSIKFGLESALLDLTNGGRRIYFDNNFSKGKKRIPINGLVWMGDEQFMREQIEEKLQAGFSTIKMKIGAINPDVELNLLKAIRKTYSPDDITLRVDANGAFTLEEAKKRLSQLAEIQVHSIEQPIKAGNWKDMKELCSNTPIPIALDEELIGVYDTSKKIELLESILPQFIILKPSLHGGISGTQEWIRLAEERKIGWWMTSALESNIGLNVIAQLTAEYQNPLPHGLGTGSLYTNNIPMGLNVEQGSIYLSLTDVR